MACTALLSIGVLTAASLAVHLGASRALHANLDDALLSIARSQIAAALHEVDGGEAMSTIHPALLALPAGSGYEEFVQLQDASGRVVARTPNLQRGMILQPDPASAARALRGGPCYGDTRVGDAPYRAIYYPLRDRHGNRLVAVIAVAREPMLRSLRSLLAVILAALVFAGGAAAIASGRLARRLTRPLSQIAEASRSVAEHNLETRIPDVSPDEELQHVTGVLNEMLSRLDAAFQNQRRFVADASHELRSPLSNLRGTVEVALRRERTGEEYRDTLRVTLNEVDRLTHLVADLLTLSRADAGALLPRREHVRLDEIARQAAAAYGGRARAAGVEVQFAAPAEVRVFGSGDRLRQVMDNLLDNALRYAPSGTCVEVTVSASEGRAIARVHDHGPGVPAEAQAHIFERFYRADPARARRSGGAGLGLPIAQALTEAHGGRIEVRSEPGCGAEFVVSIPLAAEPEAVEQRGTSG